jgi:hypothetical protein
MRRFALLLLVTLAASGARVAAAQATGTTTFNAPYRAFQRSEIGALLSFPDGGGTAIEGAYRYAIGKFDIGFKAGFRNPSGPGSTVFLVGAEARERVITHTIDFPLDGALILGAGGNFVSGSSALLFPVGLSLGRRIDPPGSMVSIIPYAQPTMFLIAGSNVPNHVQFTLGLGADFRVSHRFDVRLSAGLGDIEGVSIGAVWVH